MSGLCTYVSPEGKPCKAHSQRGKSWCWFHDPQNGEKREAARKKGGEHHAGKPALEIRQAPQTAAEVRALIGEVIFALANKTITPAEARTLIVSCNCWLSALEAEAVSTGPYQKRIPVGAPTGDDWDAEQARIIKELSASTRGT